MTMKPVNAVLQQIVSLARVCSWYCSTVQLHNHNLGLRAKINGKYSQHSKDFYHLFLAWPGVFHTLSGSIASHTFSTSKPSASVATQKTTPRDLCFSAKALRLGPLGWVDIDPQNLLVPCRRRRHLRGRMAWLLKGVCLFHDAPCSSSRMESNGQSSCINL